MSHPLLQEHAGERHLLLGNEAIVRGALEAGVNVVTCYPGTPSSEVPDTFHRLGGTSYRMEYSVNEKVAVEVAAGAALGGALTLVTMKHVGVNVAADPLLTMAYIGLPGGLVLLSADDPGCHSSQNEQDNRHYARFAGLPCFEPASAQEAKDMTREALLLARELEQPVLLRTTTRLNHVRGAVDFGPMPAPADTVPFPRNPLRFVPVPAVARGRHVELERNLEKARAKAEASRWNGVGLSSGQAGQTGQADQAGQSTLGVISSGIARAYLADALHESGWQSAVRVLELGMTWPLPEKMLGDFLRDCTRVLVVEEGAPLLEKDLRALAQHLHISVDIQGKGDVLTVYGEYSTSLLQQALAQFLGKSYAQAVVGTLEDLPGRPPNLCPGCSHRAVYYAVRQVFGDEAVYSSDIGCYTLGLLPPLRMADFLVCMGSSVSAGGGFAMASGKPVVAFIGDSTFFHSGLTGLANAVFNKHDLLLVILDNGTTAMTGHQPNPGMLQDVLGEGALHLDIEALVRALGVPHIRKTRAFNLRGTTKALEELKAERGVRVLIAEEPCVLYARRTLKKAQPQTATVVEQGEAARNCLEKLACPAFVRTAEGMSVDKTLCAGCMVCLQVAPTAFKAERKERGRNEQ